MLGKIFFLHKHCLAYKVSTHILLKYITKYFNQILQQTTPSATCITPRDSTDKCSSQNANCMSLKLLKQPIRFQILHAISL